MRRSAAQHWLRSREDARERLPNSSGQSELDSRLAYRGRSLHGLRSRVTALHMAGRECAVSSPLTGMTGGLLNQTLARLVRKEAPI